MNSRGFRFGDLGRVLGATAFRSASFVVFAVAATAAVPDADTLRAARRGKQAILGAKAPGLSGCFQQSSRPLGASLFDVVSFSCSEAVFHSIVQFRAYSFNNASPLRERQEISARRQLFLTVFSFLSTTTNCCQRVSDRARLLRIDRASHARPGPSPSPSQTDERVSQPASDRCIDRMMSESIGSLHSCGRAHFRIFSVDGSTPRWTARWDRPRIPARLPQFLEFTDRTVIRERLKYSEGLDYGPELERETSLRS